MAVLLVGLASASATAAVTVIGVQYQPDKLHPEFDCIFNSSSYPTSCPTNFAGANVHVYLRNDGTSGVNVTNVTLAGYSLKDIIKLRTQGQNDPYSIYYYWDDPPVAVFNAGEPVWWRFDPTNIPPGKVFQVAVRLRLIPTTVPVAVGVLTDAGTVTTNITVDATAPQLASVGFSPNLDKVYLHWRRAGGTAPTSIYMDGTNVTSLGMTVTTVNDTSFNFAVTVLTRTNPLAYMSYHVFQGVYGDGKRATAGLRSWVNRFNYGTYGAGPTTTQADGRAWIDDCERRGVNLLIWNNGSTGLTDLLNSSDGQVYAEEHGYDFLVDFPSKWNSTDPMGWYLRDEPDAHDYHITREDNDTPPNLYLPENNNHSVGVLAMKEIGVGDDLHYAQGGITPTVVNVDATYMPFNYYTYGQMADIGMSDPYYNSRQASAYWNNPSSIPLWIKPYPYIYAVSQAITEGSEPNPSLIAMMCTGDFVVTNGWWPFQTPECMRMQNYYAIAGGAKNLGYWWMNSGFGDGIATNYAPCVNLWKGIGLTGNEFETLQPLIVISHPAALTITPSTNIWARGLMAGLDALILVVANDRYTNDINGMHYSPISNASVTVRLPSWFNSSPTSFELTEQAEGVKDVSSSLTGSDLTLTLGTVNLTRMIVVTTNTALRASIAQRYLEKSYQGVCAFAPEHCKAQATCILNADAEGGFRGLGGGTIANNWYEFEGADGTNIVCYDETVIKHGGGHSQRIRAWKNGGTSPGASGGAYQRIPALVGTNYTVSVWIAAGDTSSLCYLGVDPSGKTDPSTGVTWSSATVSTNWVQKTWTGTATSNFMTIYYKVASTNGNKRNGYFDDATPSCTAPTITTQPVNAANCPGTTATFTVAASGPGTYSYQWQKNGVNLTTAGHYSGVTSPTLTVTGVDSSDAASYRCVVTTSYGTITSSSATLTVKAATTITTQPSAQSVCTGLNATFTVAATGDGTITYQWQTNGVNISNNSHYGGCTSASLTVTNISSADAVNYRCVVTAGCGSATSFQALLTVKAATVITLQPVSKQLSAGGTTNFTVSATGDGTVTYQWQRNSVNLSNGGHYSGVTTSMLTISSADANDTASYRCVVSAGCGSVNSSTATLTVCLVPSLLNSSFESTTNVNGVATNWFGYQRSPNPTTVWSLQTASPPAGTGTNYQQIANTSSTGGGGVRQDIKNCVIGATYTIAGWMRGNSLLYSTCTVKVSPTASTSWATAINLNPAATFTGNYWTNFSGTVVATGTNMTLWLDGQTGSTGQNKAECFDGITVTCTP